MKLFGHFIFISFGVLCILAHADTCVPVKYHSKVEEASTDNRIEMEVKTAWKENDFSKLDKLAAEYSSGQARTVSGNWKLGVFDTAVKNQLNIEWPSLWYVATLDSKKCKCSIPLAEKYDEADLRWEAIHKKILSWIQKYPDSKYAQICLAHYQSNRGWFYRGSGVSDEVPNHAWPKFREFINQSHQTLDSISWQGAPDPVWFSSMANIAISEQYSKEQLNSLLQRLYNEGSSYPDAYQIISLRFLPKWGGSYEELEKFAREAMKHAKDDEGAMLYARIYWSVDREIDGSIFMKTKANYPLVKKGFDDLLKKYPSYKNLNGKASFSCEVLDHPALQKTMKLLGNHVDRDSLKMGFDYCMRFLAEEPVYQ